MHQVLKTACPLDCPDSCSLEVTVDDGRITGIDADTGPDANPFTQGYICQKVKHQAERVYSPERVLTPMIRIAPKGVADGPSAFRAATWDEAVSVVAQRIRSSIDTTGPDSVVPYLYSSSAGVLAGQGLTPQLFERLGCPEVTHTICAATVSAAWQQVYGSMLSADPLDIASAKLVVVWGANPNASNTHLTPVITRAIKENGATLVVIDPRRTAVAKRAHLHLAIRPGTDAVLAYAVTNWLVANDGIDREFIAEHIEGAEEFIAAAAAWPLAAAAAECGVSVAEIEAFAALVATREPAMLRLGWGLERNRNGGSGCVGAISLWALAGHFGRRGAGIVKSTSGTAPIDLDRLWPEHVVRSPRRQMGMNDVCLAMAGVLEGWPQTQVLFVQGANPAVTAMDQTAWLRELQRPDLFTVVHDQVFTDTAASADVILPATTHFEAGDLVNSYGSFSLLRIDPVIAPVGESRSNDAASAAIAIAIGFDAAEFDADPERMAAKIRIDALPSTASVPATRAGISTIQFVDTVPSFADGSTRARLHDPSSELPLPRHVSIATSRLTLVTPSTNRTINSMFAEFDPPDAVLSMHPDDAGPRGIVDGAVVRVFNESGEIEIVARVDGVVRPGVVAIPKGLWRRHVRGGLTSNALIPHMVNDLAAGACFNDAQVEVELASG
jgi:anaerobic selenocysteine-containing dehydrogenase